jgi:hypothetical protein
MLHNIKPNVIIKVKGNRLPETLVTVSSIDEPIQCRERLAGMLNYYHRVAA